MRAVVENDPRQRAWEHALEPAIIDDSDAMMRVDTVRGTDLHVLKGDVPTVTDEDVPGHEAVGTVERVGAEMRTVRPGDRLLVSCITACRRCHDWRRGPYGQYVGGVADSRHTVNGFLLTAPLGTNAARPGRRPCAGKSNQGMRERQ